MLHEQLLAFASLTLDWTPWMRAWTPEGSTPQKNKTAPGCLCELGQETQLLHASVCSPVECM